MKNLEIVHENVALLSDEEFSMIRRDGVGASDTAAILGTYASFGTTKEQLLQQKLQTGYTDEEKAISNKPAVKKGRDLESLILQKASKALDKEVIKDVHMYRLKEAPWLTVNFDGIVDEAIPVEAKFCTTYGDKYYNFSKAADEPMKFISEDVFECAEFYGVPPYYYTQLQQQLIASESDHGYLAILRDKDWTLYLFKIHANPKVQDKIKIETYQFWQQVKKFKNL